MTETHPTFIGGYEIRRRIGHGAMAAVYVARDPKLGREVAIKVLQPALAPDPEHRERFLREARVNLRLHHAAILPVYELGEAGDSLYIVMMLAGGGSLERRLREGPPPTPAETARIIAAIADGLDHAHERGIVHRDLKPGNILFDESGNPYIADFGIARFQSEASTRVTQTGTIMGTPAYISPEQATGRLVSRQTDVYALAAIAYEMLTGAPPFAGGSVIQVIYRHLSDPLPRADLAEAVYAVLAAGMGKQPEDRPESAGAFAKSLADVLEVPAGVDAPPRSSRRSFPRPAVPAPPPEPGTSETAPVTRRAHALEPGDHIAEYRIVERLDQGDRTRVYHAFDERRNREVAIRMIPVETDGTDRIARLRKEAALLGRLHHAHIIPFFDFGTTDHAGYLVMPLLGGRSLETRIHTGGPLPLELTVELCRQISGALQYLHGEGIVSRELKPTGLVFDRHENVYLADLRIAKNLTEPEDARLTVMGQPLGTPMYMSPEQFLGDRITPAADQYVLACLVFEMLTGRRPFEADSPFALLLKHVREEPPAVSSLRDDVPAPLDEALGTALAKDPARRYPDVMAFHRQLAAACEPRPGDNARIERRTGHVFISYCREDGDFAHRLADELRSRGMEVWIDARLEPSDQWWRVIVDAIERCVAFVSIMSPDADRSKWVEREVLLADQRGKPPFPVLLSGEAFPIYVGTQYVDVRNTELPDDAFFDRLSRVARGPQVASGR